MKKIHKIFIFMSFAFLIFSSCNSKTKMLMGTWVIEKDNFLEINNNVDYLLVNMLVFNDDKTCGFPEFSTKRENGKWKALESSDNLIIEVSELSDIYNGKYEIIYPDKGVMTIKSLKNGLQFDCVSFWNR